MFSDNVYDIPLSFQELVKHPNMKVGIKDKEKALLLKLLTAYFVCSLVLGRNHHIFRGRKIKNATWA